MGRLAVDGEVRVDVVVLVGVGPGAVAAQPVVSAVDVGAEGLVLGCASQRLGGVVVQRAAGARLVDQVRATKGRSGVGIEHGAVHVLGIGEHQERPGQARPAGLAEDHQARAVPTPELRLAPDAALGAHETHRLRGAHLAKRPAQRLARAQPGDDRRQVERRLRRSGQAQQAPVSDRGRRTSVQCGQATVGLAQPNVGHPVARAVFALHREAIEVPSIQRERLALIAEKIEHDGAGRLSAAGRQRAAEIGHQARCSRAPVDAHERTSPEAPAQPALRGSGPWPGGSPRVLAHVDRP